MSYPDDSRDDPGNGPPDGQAEPEPPFDEEAAWRAIVENYGDRPTLGAHSPDTPTALVEPPESPPSLVDPTLRPRPPVEPAEPAEGTPRETNPFDRSYLDAQAAEVARARESWSDEGHFVPPEPPPLPHVTPARRLAWIGLFGAPLLMLLAVIAHLTYPAWFSLGLVAAFVGGFVFLVATMERPGGDGWGGDDGAVV